MHRPKFASIGRRINAPGARSDRNDCVQPLLAVPLNEGDYVRTNVTLDVNRDMKLGRTEYLNRHGILHSRFFDYPTALNSSRVFLFVDAVAELWHEKQDALAPTTVQEKPAAIPVRAVTGLAPILRSQRNCARSQISMSVTMHERCDDCDSARA